MSLHVNNKFAHILYFVENIALDLNALDAFQISPLCDGGGGWCTVGGFKMCCMHFILFLCVKHFVLHHVFERFYINKVRFDLWQFFNMLKEMGLHTWDNKRTCLKWNTHILYILWHTWQYGKGPVCYSVRSDVGRRRVHRWHSWDGVHPLHGTDLDQHTVLGIQHTFHHW